LSELSEEEEEEEEEDDEMPVLNLKVRFTAFSLRMFSIVGIL
jgi:hypothetical protein